jgi:hypothetical protein
VILLQCVGTTKEVVNNFEKIICKNEECNRLFEPKTYNSIYCSAECRKKVTNKRLLDKYHSNKINSKLKRVCRSKDCDTILSRYNKENICEKCKEERLVKRLLQWGWSEERARGNEY